jgi:hypothetical protein
VTFAESIQFSFFGHADVALKHGFVLVVFVCDIFREFRGPQRTSVAQEIGVVIDRSKVTHGYRGG